MQTGDLINERYTVDALIGKGGMGQTYRATDSSSGKEVALKILNFSKLTNWKELELFEREIEVLKSIKNPLIPNYIDHFETDIGGQTELVLVQEYVRGDNLHRLIKGGRRFSEDEIGEIIQSLLETVSYIHKLNPPIVHRDINPKNIVQDQAGRVYLVDFGAVGHIVSNTLAAVRSNTFVGTLGYMPPEQLYGKVTPSSDIYSLGVTILFLLTGKEPSQFELINMRLDYHDHVKISSALRTLLDRMIEPDMNKRLGDAAAALSELRAHQEPEASGARAAEEQDDSQEQTIEGLFVIEEEEEEEAQRDAAVPQHEADKEQPEPKESGLPLPAAQRFSEAINSKDIEIVQKIINDGFDVNSTLAKDKTPLKLALDRRRLEIGELLIAKGANVNATYSGRSLLHDAARRGDVRFAELLLLNGADAKAKDRQGKTPLGHAREHNRDPVIGLLKGWGRSGGSGGRSNARKRRRIAERERAVRFTVRQFCNLIPMLMLLLFYMAFFEKNESVIAFLQSVTPFEIDFANPPGRDTLTGIQWDFGNFSPIVPQILSTLGILFLTIYSALPGSVAGHIWSNRTVKETVKRIVVRFLALLAILVVTLFVFNKFLVGFPAICNMVIMALLLLQVTNLYSKRSRLYLFYALLITLVLGIIIYLVFSFL